MNDHPIDDPELGHLLGASRDELVSRPPRPDHRVGHLLGGSTASVFDHPTSELPIAPLTPLPAEPAPSRRRHRLAIAGAAAATLLLITAVAAFVARRDSTPSLAAVASTPDRGEGDGGEPPAAAPEPAAPAPTATVTADEPSPDETHEWLQCVLGAVTASIDADDVPDLDELRSTCGEPPAGELAGPGHGLLDPDEWPLHEWDLDELPFDLDDLDPDAWGFGEVCDEQQTADGVSIECAWPSCDGDDVEPFCLELDLDLDGDLADWFERLPGELDELFADPTDPDAGDRDS